MEGFESQPDGAMLGQLILDFDTVGLAYERCIAFYKDFHAHDRPMFVLPRFGTRMSIEIESSGKSFMIDENDVFFLPAGLRHNDRSESRIYDTLALYPTPNYFESLCRQLKVEYGDQISLSERQEPMSFKRSLFQTECIDNVVHRFVSKSPPGHFVLQLYFAAFFDDLIANAHGAASTTIHDADKDLAMTIKRKIESNLFRRLTNKDLVDYFGKSQPTITKIFRSAYGVSPMQYIRSRRLQEASKLVRDPKLSIDDIAALVGYSDAAAFSHAFKNEFGVAPRSNGRA
ncbi:MAG: helix-turn-helix transcriptional regulator [Pseudobacteriovorax sp.]|nr:helix-turn-helix transcriptional regulator [Pseudobacteriovorax sp.]